MSSEPTLTSLVATNVLDAELAGLLWLLRGRGLGLVVGGRSPGSAAALADALEAVAQAAAGRGRHRAEDAPRESLTTSPLILLDADSLETVFVQLAAPPFSLAADQQRGLGVVLITRALERLGPRLLSAHYLRPVERDAGGHLQRRPPALLAARDEQLDRLEHFAWAVTTELAERAGLGLAEFEAAHRERMALLDELIARHQFGSEALLSALGPHRPC